jgi:hypothetical protein
MGKKKKNSGTSGQIPLDFSAPVKMQNLVSAAEHKVVAFPQKKRLAGDLDSAFQRIVEMSHKLPW